MAKVQGPFLSQTASGSVGNALTARRVNGAAVMSMKRVRGTKFPQSRPESVSAILWWNRGNAFKVSAAFLPVLETEEWVVAVRDSDGGDATWREVIDYIVAQGDAQIGIKSSRSRRGFFVQQSLINLISLELDRAEEFFPQIETAIEFRRQFQNPYWGNFFGAKPARKYVDAFFGPRDISPNILLYIWGRIFIGWFGARLPYAFFQTAIGIPDIPANRQDYIIPVLPLEKETQQGAAAASPRPATPPPAPPVMTLADLEAALAARAHIR